MKRYFLFTISFLMIALLKNATAQSDIVYADVNNNDLQRMNFEIIGKTVNNYLIYKEVKGKHWISVYDENMKELENVPITILPAKADLLDVAFYPYRNGAWLIFQHQQGNVVFCEAAKIEANGRILQKPVVLDTTMIAYKAENRIYNQMTSDDRSKIILFKINRKDKELYKMNTKLFDHNLSLLNNGWASIPMNADGDYLTGYSLDNDGNLVFVKYNRMKSGDIGAASLMVKPAASNDIKSMPLDIRNLFLDDIKVRIDDKNQKYLLMSFYSEKKKGNLSGLYTYAWNKAAGNVAYEKSTPLSEDLKKRAKKGSRAKTAFNDYFINNIVLHDDGSYTIGSEVLYTTNSGGMWDRWGYWGSPYFYGSYGGMYGGIYGGYWGGWSPWSWGWGRFGYWSPYYYYSPFFYRSYWWGNSAYEGTDRYHADNIAVFSFDKDGNKLWDNVIAKKQNGTGTDGTVSYQIMKKGNDMHFFINNSGKISDLEDVSFNNDGSIFKANPIAAKDKRSEFMPRYAKQISNNEMIIPVLNKKTISFARVKF